jgi:hypothetical protein
MQNNKNSNGSREERRKQNELRYQGKCEELAMSHATILSEEHGVIYAEREGVRSVLHRAVDEREIWRETYQMLIVLWLSHPPRPQPAPFPKQHVSSQKRSRKEILNAEIGTFLKQYARKAHAGHEPNDRSYSRKIERVVKRMRPEDLDALIQGPEDENKTDTTGSS